MTAFRKLTEMTRQRFDQLLQELDEGILLERWTESKIPETKAELVESRQIRALGMIVNSGTLRLADLQAKRWNRLEIWANGESVSMRLIHSDK